MRTAIVAAFCLALTACGGQPPRVQPPYPSPRANVSETLNIGLAASSVAAYLNAIENDPAFAGDAVGIQAMPQYAPRLRASVATRSYTDAFDDAQTKARALAAHLGGHLGGVRSISEVSSTFQDRFARTNGQGSRENIAAPGVSTEPSGLTTLTVAFASDRGEITVYGSHAAEQAQDSLQYANGVSLMLNTRGKDLAEASARLKSLDSTARRIASRYGADASKITVQAANVSSY